MWFENEFIQKFLTALKLLVTKYNHKKSTNELKIEKENFANIDVFLKVLINLTLFSEFFSKILKKLMNDKKMDKGTAIRIAVLIGLISIAQLQLFYGRSKQDFAPPKVAENIEEIYIDDVEDLKTEMTEMARKENKYSMPLPLVNRSVPKSDASWAEEYLRLPIWSSGFNKCDSDSAEVSCFEIHRAAKTIEKWTKSVNDQKTTGQVFVDVQDQNFPDRLSMLYQGFQIAIATNRDLITDKSKFDPISLPDCVKTVSDDIKNGGGGFLDLPTDHSLGCADLSDRYPNLKLSGFSWPQVMYTHSLVAPKLREAFGYHSAYLIGNFLFGQTEKPSNECFQETSDDVVEGWYFEGDVDMLRPSNYRQFMHRCGFVSNQATMVTNDDRFESSSRYKETFRIQKTQASYVCALRKLTSSKRILQTFGSRLGFWATALQGRKGSFMNGINRICINMTNSQQGSLWHTYCPVEKQDYLFRANSRFFICGPNINDARLYLKYLLW
ncbi:hypothetical protein TRFO_08479 [Tritrichomonas foetus]|uniref:Uncharacterized protein n=1 Tax=Tritrichomonas foetus TaxID=1144522 RepID=A0A1J4JJ99_9EUKA|nr:hypothetical protein TRFO_08479 [Tritrichomonas foetus]|eukprot:OHS99232.1 hypothetical protein TRFO_08479 [Tritrichomonas foetus]